MRFRIMVFADITARRSSCGVKITQRHITHLISHIIISQHFFDHQLRAAVNISRVQTAVLFNGNALRLSVYCRRRRKNDIIYASAFHCFQKMQRPLHIIKIILGRIFHRFADQTAGSKMNDRVDLKLGHDMLQKSNIMDIALHQLHLFRHCRRMACGKIIVNDRCETVFLQFFNYM